MYPDENVLRVGSGDGNFPLFIVCWHVTEVAADADAPRCVLHVLLHCRLIDFSCTERGVFLVECRTHASDHGIALAYGGKHQNEHEETEYDGYGNGYFKGFGKEYIYGNAKSKAEYGGSRA